MSTIAAADDEDNGPMELEDQPEQRWQDVLPRIQHTFEDAKPWWCAGKLECREYSGKVYFWANFDTCACGETQTSMVILGKKTAVPLKDRMDAAVRKVLAKVLPVLSHACDPHVPSGLIIVLLLLVAPQSRTGRHRLRQGAPGTRSLEAAGPKNDGC